MAGLELGGFSVASTYALQQNRSEDNAWSVWRVLWSLKVQSRVRVFIWLTAHDRTLTKFSHWGRKMTMDPMCSLCDVGVESIVHALRDCAMREKSGLTFYHYPWLIDSF